GCGQRVRPVLMTALTTVCGLIPMALSTPTGDGIDYRTLATIVAGGLAASTFFTLWVVPLAYTVFDDLGRIMASRFKWWLRKPRLRRREPDPLVAHSVEP
ncbi:MAG: efflux RND transporter permease subunit, partial [Planctomycetota bacterium]|nr:efflux RND transporter permease subunit [Planctomycetota bacterium]